MLVASALCLLIIIIIIIIARDGVSLRCVIVMTNSAVAVAAAVTHLFITPMLDVLSHSKSTANRNKPYLNITLKFNRVLEVVEVHVRAKFHQTDCGDS